MKLLFHTVMIGGLPLLSITFLNRDPAFSLSLKELTARDIPALLPLVMLCTSTVQQKVQMIFCFFKLEFASFP